MFFPEKREEQCWKHWANPLWTQLELCKEIVENRAVKSSVFLRGTGQLVATTQHHGKREAEAE